MMKQALTPTEVRTMAVLAARYRGARASLETTRTHTVARVGAVEWVLCRRVLTENLADGGDETALPTCPRCLRLDPRRA